MRESTFVEPHKLVVVYDGEEGGYAVLAHNLNTWDSNRLAQRLVDQYDLDAHVVSHRVRHDGVGDAGQCEACHSMVDDIIEEAQKAKPGAITVVNTDDGQGMCS